MANQRPLAPDFEKAQPATIRNPYIVNFCKVLLERKGEEPEPEAKKKLVEDMYNLYENLLGQNMVQALPEDVRRQYKEMANDLYSLDYEKIAEIFGTHISDEQEVAIRKKTLQELADIFMKNRDLSTREVLQRLEDAEEAPV